LKLKNTSLAALACAARLRSAALSQADLIVSEDFDTYSGWGGLIREHSTRTAMTKTMFPKLLTFLSAKPIISAILTTTLQMPHSNP
jgi:hypothetical protein